MLSDRERYLISVILEYKRRGYGYWKIGRKLFPNLNPRAAMMRVVRLIKKYEKYSDASSSGYITNGSGRRRPDLDSVEFPVRVGRTQKLVLAALIIHGGRARFSVINREVAEYLGVDPEVTKRRVWAALNRLRSRGLVGSLGGVYWITWKAGGDPAGPPVGLWVENFRIRNHLGRVIQVWAKRNSGRPASLGEALVLATLRSANRTVQVEIAAPLPEKLGKIMGELGVSIVKIYRDPSPPYNGRPKVEASFEYPPLHPHIAARERWVEAFLGLMRRIVEAMFAGGLVGALQ